MNVWEHRDDGPHPGTGLTGAVGIVTGASRGIGAAVSRALARAGVHLVIAARTDDALRGLAAELSAAHDVQVEAVPTDMTDPAAVRALVEQAVDRFGRLDLAVNNAGGGFTGKTPVAELDPEAFETMLRLNLHSTQWALRYEIPAMIASGGGAVVNMSSGSGQRAAAGMGGYVAAKHGVEGLTKVAALDHASDGVRVNALAPGPVRAGAFDHMDRQFRDLAARSSPLGRVAEPEEVAEAAVWLCSPAAAYVNGAVLPVDGGQSAGHHGGAR